MAGGMCGRGHTWQGGMCGRGHGGGCAWQGGMCGRGACMSGGVHAMHTPPPRHYKIRSVNARAVRILLECILVLTCVCFYHH